MKKRANLTFILLAIIICSSCSQAFLDAKPRSSLIVPRTLSDFSQLLNNQLMFETSDLAEISSDDYYLDHAYWEGLPEVVRNAHVWAEDLYGSAQSEDAWNRPYHQVLYANVVLDGLAKIAMVPSNEHEWNRLSGSAKFIRAYAFFNLAQLFAPPYFTGDSGDGLGIPLRLSSDINERTSRSSVHETYARILEDLIEASRLLPSEVSPGRPNRAAAHAMLARTYLSMADYAQAMLHADSCLALYSTLLDFNDVTASSYDVKTGIVYGTGVSYPKLMGYAAPDVMTPPELYNLYYPDDLRREIYYRHNLMGYPYKGQSHSYYYHFTGLATDEVYLTRAECHARLGHHREALGDLNHLLLHRYVEGEYEPIVFDDSMDVLSLVLRERRKELVFRNLRWMDLRRLNLEGAAITPARNFAGKHYEIRPNSLLWVLPIPRDEIVMNGIKQNIRSGDRFYYNLGTH